MNFADKQKKNRWDSINNPNSESLYHKTHKSELKSNVRPKRKQYSWYGKISSTRTYDDNHNKRKNSTTKEPYQENNSFRHLFVKKYKIINDGSYKPSPLTMIKNNFFIDNKTDSNELKSTICEFKSTDLLDQINVLIDRISNTYFFDEGKNRIENEFNEIQKNIENTESQDAIKRNEELIRVYDSYIKTFYEVGFRDIKSKLKSILDDISNLTFNNFEKKYLTFYFDYLCNDNVINSISNLIENDFDFSKNFRHILDYFIKNESSILIKRYNALINQLKKPGYKNKKTLDSLIDEYDAIIPQLDNINILKDYFNYKKINFKKLNVSSLVGKSNKRFIDGEYAKHKDFFDNFMGKQLDQDQIDIVLSDEDNMKIIAGAGSGKTFTLQAKLKYLLDFKEVSPDKILCISFSNTAVDDLKRKINETIGDNDIDVFTYHAFGSNLLKNNRIKYTFNENLLSKTIDYYFEEHVLSDEGKMKKIIDFFNLYNYEANINKRHLEFVEKGGFFEIQDNNKLDTLKNKVRKSLTTYELLDEEKISYDRNRVRSYEELVIANFLYVNNIDYVYECDYFSINEPADDEKFTQYRPDFYLPEYDIYIEHFGVDENLNAKWLNSSDKRKYKESIKWKRNIHKKYNTNLIETYSFYNSNGVLLDKLKSKLSDKVEFGEIDYGMIYERLIKNKQLDYLDSIIKIIKRFILLFKDMGLNIDEYGNDCFNSSFDEIANQIDLNDDFTKSRNKFLIDIIKDIFNIYNSKDSIDFADMINKPTILLKSDCKIKDYDYIFVDEYQDTSINKYKFLKEIKNKTNAKLIVIGDDWQSIYGFNGCKIELFTNFEDYFDHTKVFKIQKTYRNSEDLINLSSKFIKRNNSQIQKDLNSDKKLPYNPIKVTKASSPLAHALIFENIIEEIVNRNPEGEILILGRYKDDFKKILVPDLFVCDNLFNYDDVLENKGYLKITYLKNEKIDIKFRTMHKSKGLQSDNVIIIGLIDENRGFPNKFGDDSLIRYILNRPDEGISYAEERRLFYVSLTRTKNRVYLISDKDDPSDFVEELLYLDDENTIEFRRYGFNIDDKFRMKRLLNKQFNQDLHHETNLECSFCGGKIYLIRENGRGKFKCNDCDIDYGHYNKPIEYMDKLDFCNEKGCTGLSYIYKNKYKNCTMYYKTKCNPKFDYDDFR